MIRRVAVPRRSAGIRRLDRPLGMSAKVHLLPVLHSRKAVARHVVPFVRVMNSLLRQSKSKKMLLMLMKRKALCRRHTKTTAKKTSAPVNAVAEPTSAPCKNLDWLRSWLDHGEEIYAQRENSVLHWLEEGELFYHKHASQAQQSPSAEVLQNDVLLSVHQQPATVEAMPLRSPSVTLVEASDDADSDGSDDPKSKASKETDLTSSKPPTAVETVRIDPATGRCTMCRETEVCLQHALVPGGDAEETLSHAVQEARSHRHPTLSKVQAPQTGNDMDLAMDVHIEHEISQDALDDLSVRRYSEVPCGSSPKGSDDPSPKMGKDTLGIVPKWLTNINKVVDNVEKSVEHTISDLKEKLHISHAHASTPPAHA